MAKRGKPLTFAVPVWKQGCLNICVDDSGVPALQLSIPYVCRKKDNSPTMKEIVVDVSECARDLEPEGNFLGLLGRNALIAFWGSFPDLSRLVLLPADYSPIAAPRSASRRTDARAASSSWQ